MGARPWWVQVLVVCGGALGILLVALVNGYPLVYSDTGTYLRSAFTGFVPEDRPYWYGLFIQLTSLNGRSLWGVVVAQALLCSTLLWRCWRVFGDGRWWTFLLTVFVLAPITGLGWYAGQLVADIFSVIGVLAAALLLCAKAGGGARAALATVVVVACWVHLSNLLIVPLVSVAFLLALRRTLPAVRRARVVLVAATVLFAWCALPLANRAVSGQAHISRYSHVFLMSRLVETGMLKTWLAEHCATDPVRLCLYRDSLPTTNKAFMWGEHSPLRTEGGAAAVQAEYAHIINATFAQPRYLLLHVQGSVRSTAELLTLWRVADELEGDFYRMDYSAPYGSIAGLVPHELPMYLRSAQNTGDGKLGLRTIDAIYRLVLGLALLCAVVLVAQRHHRQHALPVIVLGAATLVFGAWVCASLSTVDSRFMSRTAWLLPVVVAMYLWKVQGRSAQVKG
ncbi:MAG: hypothetical protein JNM62_08890 [Flavobacteriales bacterium]|nr:hypothetical protein [Flavobacteriales bacterium]